MLWHERQTLQLGHLLHVTTLKRSGSVSIISLLWVNDYHHLRLEERTLSRKHRKKRTVKFCTKRHVALRQVVLFITSPKSFRFQVTQPSSTEASSPVTPSASVPSTSLESGYFSQEHSSPIRQINTDYSTAESRAESGDDEIDGDVPPPQPETPEEVPPRPEPPLEETPTPTPPVVEATTTTVTTGSSEDSSPNASPHLTPQPAPIRKSLMLALENDNASVRSERAMSIPTIIHSDYAPTNGAPSAFPIRDRSKSESVYSRPKPQHPSRPPPIPPKPKDDTKKKRWPTLRLQRKEKDMKEVGNLNIHASFENLDDFNAQGPAIRRYNRISSDVVSPHPSSPSLPVSPLSSSEAFSPQSGERSPQTADIINSGRSSTARALFDSEPRNTPSPEFASQLRPSFHVVANGNNCLPPSEALPEVCMKDVQCDDDVSGKHPSFTRQFQHSAVKEQCGGYFFVIILHPVSEKQIEELVVFV